MTTRILALQPRLLAVGWIVSLALSGCDGGDDAATSSLTAPSTTLSGAVVKGPVGGASVCAFAVAGAARGAALGNCVTTDATGIYSLSVPIAAGPVWLEATGGSYTDEATAATLSLAAGVVLTALVDANGTAASAYLTPLTTLALNAAVAAANVTPAGFTQGSAALLAAFGLPAGLDILGSAPVVSGIPNAYGQALINISRIVANGLPLARLLATSNAASLSAAYAAAAAAAAAPPPAPTPTPTPPAASATATGSLAITGATSATLVPDADGFLVKVANEDDLTFEFRRVTALAVGSGTANVTTSVAVAMTPPSVGRPNGTMTVTVRNPNGTFNPGLPQFTACATDCGVTIARPAGSTHPVTLTFNNAAIGNLVLNGTVTGDASGALWSIDEIPRSTDGVLGINGSNSGVASAIRRATFDSNGGTEQPTLRTVQLLMADGALVNATQQFDAAGALVQTTVARFVSVTQIPSCTGNGPAATCGITITASTAGTALRFNGTTLSDGTVLSNTIFVANTLSTLTAAPLGAFAPTRSFFKSENAVRTFTFDVLGTAAQSGISLVSVTTRGTAVIEVSLNSNIGSGVYSCLEKAEPFFGIPACSGGTVSANGLTVTFNKLALVGGPLSDRKQNLTLDGSLTAKGR